jgi:hypothetical protein
VAGARLKDRSLVAILSAIAISLLLTIAINCSAAGDDLIVSKNGKHETGKLASCLRDSCRLNDRVIPRAAIAWIGLSYAGHEPPGAPNPATDEVLTRSGSVDSARLLSITASQVITEKRSYSRTEVAWIHLAQPLGGRAGGRGQGNTTFHYDVVAKGHAQSALKRTDTNLNETIKVTLDWTATFKNVAFKKVTATVGDQFIVAPVGSGPIKGKTDVQYAFEFTYVSSLYAGPQCHGTAQLESLDSVLLLSGENTNKFEFSTLLELSAGEQLATTMLNEAVDACTKQRFRVYEGRGEPQPPVAPEFPMWPSGDDTVAVVDGVTIGRFIITLSVNAKRPDTPGPLLSPVKELATGAGFSLATGEVDRKYSCGEGCTVDAMTELKVNVTPHH